jgi:Asp/Glu/hydantoin racemase
MLLALMMGYKFGVVTPSPFLNDETEQSIARYGLTERLAGLLATPEKGHEQEMALMDAHHGIECFKKVGRELIAVGAQVLIPGCGLMSPALRLAPRAEKEYPNGFIQVDGIPIMDVIGVTLKMLEVLITLKRAGSSWVNPNGFYAEVVPGGREKSGKIAPKEDGLSFWDC